MKGNRLLWLAPFLVGLSGFAGYSAGTTGKQDTRPSEEALPADRAQRSGDRTRTDRGDPIRHFRDLLAPDSRETDVWKIVSRLPDDRLADALREVRERLAATPSRGSEAERLAEIESALYFRWAEFDPEAALADVSAIPKSLDFHIEERREALLKSVLAAWMRSDPDAAYVAVKEHEDFRFIGRNMLVQTWTAENVFENLDRHPDKRRDLLGWYCVAAAKDETQRDAMLAALEEQPDMKDGDWAKFMLFRSWGYDDFKAAVETAKERGYQDRVAQIVEDNLQSKPHLALPFAVESGFTPAGVQWERGFNEWLGFDGPAARSWLQEQAPRWEADGHVAVAVAFLAEDFVNAGKVHAATERESAANRLTQNFIKWRREDPNAAGNWFDTAPEAARELLLSKPHPGHE